MKNELFSAAMAASVRPLPCGEKSVHRWSLLQKYERLPTKRLSVRAWDDCVCGVGGGRDVSVDMGSYSCLSKGLMDVREGRSR